MNIKRLVAITVIIYMLISAAVLIGGLLFSDPAPGVNPAQTLINLNTVAQDGIATRVNTQAEEIAMTDDSVSPPKKVTTTVVPKNSPAQAPSQSAVQPKPAPAPACGSGGSCTLAQVAQHSSPSDCWVIYASKVYNITSYTNHPGGSSVFNSTSCGGDITSYLNGTASTGGQQHTHSGGAYNDLAPFLIASLSG